MEYNRILARLAHEATQFESIYRLPARTNRCPPSSLGYTLPIPLESKPARAPSAHTILNRLASDVIHFGFVYPDTRDLFSPKKRDFLVPRPSLEAEIKERTDENLAHMRELNRLARLYEASPDACVYPSFSTNVTALLRDAKKSYGSRFFPNPFAHSLRRKLKLTEGATFKSAFPATDKPKVSLLNGAPRIDSSTFTSLLRLKCQSACQILGTQHLPSTVTKLIVHWINTILLGFSKTNKKTPPPRNQGKPAQQDTTLSTSAEQTERNTLEEKFATSEPAPKRPESPSAMSDIFDADDLPTPPPPLTVTHDIVFDVSCFQYENAIPIKKAIIPSAVTLTLSLPSSNPHEDQSSTSYAVRECKLAIKRLLAKSKLYQAIGRCVIPKDLVPVLEALIPVSSTLDITEKDIKSLFPLWTHSSDSLSAISFGPVPSNDLTTLVSSLEILLESLSCVLAF
jgi:hypothetical protein